MKTNNKNTKTNFELAQELTKKTLVKRSSQKKSMNQYLLEVLKDRKVERMNIVTEITLKRLEDNKVEIDFKNEEFIETFIKLSKTVKNGVDTSISNSNNNSSFSYNQDFKQYTLKEVGPKVYTIVDNK